MPRALEVARSIANGVFGSHLARVGSTLATELTLVHRGRPVRPDRWQLKAAFPKARREAVLFVHGLAVDEGVFAFPKQPNVTYGSLLAARLRVTPLFVRYNTGLHVSQNGEALANVLEALVDAWPGGLESLTLVGYSMGGLVVRSACHVAQLRGDRWLGVARRAIYLGVPHLGAPLEKFGKVVTATLRKAKNPVTSLLADAIDLRSDGVKDLGFGALRAQDWGGEAGLRDPHHPVPLLPGIAHHVVVGAVAAHDRSWLTVLFGDGMVRQTSASGRRGAKDLSPLFPAESVVVLPGVSHLGLAHSAAVVPHLLAWCRKHPARKRPAKLKPSSASKRAPKRRR